MGSVNVVQVFNIARSDVSGMRASRIYYGGAPANNLPLHINSEL